MISKDTFTNENIQRIVNKYKTTYELTKRAVYALGLVEALRKVGLDFIFKGGSSMMLLFEMPKRLSTDADIVVAPDCDVDYFIKKASMIYPFVSYEESIRKTNKTISKKHFKFTYKSPSDDRYFNVLLDVLFANNNYKKLLNKPIKNNLLIGDESDPLFVKVPTPESLLGDKLTAFAPHTIGVNFFNDTFTNDKRLEVIKQFYDVGTLLEVSLSFTEIKETYFKIAKDEIEYRNNKYTIDDCLQDTFYAALSILSLGKFMKEDYLNYLDGFKRITEHIVGLRLNPNNSYHYAAKIMLLVSCLKTNKDIFSIKIQPKNLIKDAPFNQINRLYKID